MCVAVIGYLVLLISVLFFVYNKTKNDKDMSVWKMAAILFILRVFQIIVDIFYIPAYIIRLFRKPLRCPPITDNILLTPAVQLAQQIRSKQLTSEMVIKAYISRILEVNPILNAVIDTRFEKALEEAKEADKLISNGTFSLEELEVKYPLLGVPITVKGSIAIEGMRNTSGLVDRNEIQFYDAVIVQRVKEAGAIPILTSNVPELCLNWETRNKLIGTTNNPYNTTRVAGGSSGGEASLLGSGASVIGLGSDIGGSLRLPAHFCGVYGHKPTSGVVSLIGHYPSCKNEEVWAEVFSQGPITRYASDLPHLLNVVVEPQFKERLRLSEPVDLRNMKMYYMESTCEPLARNVNRNVLTALHEVIGHFNSICSNCCEEVKIPLMKKASLLSDLKLLDIDHVDNLFPNDGKGAYAELFRFLTCRSNREFNSIIYAVLRRILNKSVKKSMSPVNNNIRILREEILNMLGENGVLILPCFPEEALHHGDVLRKIFSFGYLSIFNTLGLPVTCCHVRYTKKGLPIGIQVVAPQHCDRYSISVAMEIEKTFGGWQPPSTVEVKQ